MKPPMFGRRHNASAQCITGTTTRTRRRWTACPGCSSGWQRQRRCALFGDISPSCICRLRLQAELAWARGAVHLERVSANTAMRDCNLLLADGGARLTRSIGKGDAGSSIFRMTELQTLRTRHTHCTRLSCRTSASYSLDTYVQGNWNFRPGSSWVARTQSCTAHAGW